jgi:hypothetical protein
MIKIKFYNEFKKKWPAFKWLVVGPLRKSKWDVFRIVLLQSLSTIFQVAGFVLIIRFVNLIISEWTAFIYNKSFDLSEHKIVVFWVVFVATLFLLVIGAFFSYISRKKIASLARIGEENVLIEVTKLYIKSFTKLNKKVDNPAGIDTLRTFYNRGGRFFGRVIMAVINSLVPFILMLLSLIVLIYFRPLLTLFLVSLLLLALPLYVKVAIRGREASADLMKHARQSTIDKNQFIDYLRFSIGTPEDLDQEDIKWIIGTDSTLKFMDAYELRLRITALSTFLTQVLIAVMLIAILLSTIYPMILQQASTIVTSLAYLVAFKFFSGGLISTMNTFIILNVFYIYCKSMVKFLEQSSNENISSEAFFSRSIISNEKKSALAHGKPLAVNFYMPVDWSNINFIIQNLNSFVVNLNFNSINRSRLLTSDTPVIGADLPEQLYIFEERKWKDILLNLNSNLSTDKNIQKEIKKIQQGDCLTTKDWKAFSPDLKLFIKGIILKSEPDPLIIFVDGANYLKIRRNLHDKFLELLRNHYIIVVFHGNFKFSHIKNNLFQTFACINPEGLSWIGDFNEARKKNITINSFTQNTQNGTKEDIFDSIDDF